MHKTAGGVYNSRLGRQSEIQQMKNLLEERESRLSHDGKKQEILRVSSFPDSASGVGQPLPQWYVLYTRSRAEKKLLYELSVRDIEVFLPMREIISRWKDRRKKIWVPLFPGYIFVNHVDTPENRYRVLNVPGAVHFVGVHDRLNPVPEEQILAIRRLLENNLSIDPYPYIQIGTQVEIIAGPLAGIRGMLIEKRGRFRFIVQVDMIRQAISVEVDASDIRPL